jgi:hypothetical protein
MIKNLIVFAVIGLLSLFSLGHFWSDSTFVNALITKESLRSPDDAFSFLLRSKSPARASDPVISGQSLVELMERKNDRLWCDEGSIVLAAINNRLGYDTRLVDFLDRQGISRHTVLQVYVGGTWVTYDFTNRKSNIDLKTAVDFRASFRFRAYPSTEHMILMSNYFIRKPFQLVRPLI